eukprot:6210991-Pyramimonas_sp.AAC.1
MASASGAAGRAAAPPRTRARATARCTAATKCASTRGARSRGTNLAVGSTVGSTNGPFIVVVPGWFHSRTSPRYINCIPASSWFQTPLQMLV